MKHFSVRPATTLRGRTFKGLRGWAGKPLHPPLTDIPIGAYVITAILDVISIVARDESWARDVFRASTFVLAIGVIAALPTALRGFWDWLRSTEPGTQVRREANAHARVMILVTVLAITNLALRTLAYGDDSHMASWWSSSRW